MKKGKMILISAISIIAVLLVIFQVIANRTVELHHRIEINASPERVWAILNNLEEVAAYNPQIEKATSISAVQRGIGSSRECQMHDGSLVKERVVQIEKDAITMELYESSWPVKEMNWRTSLSTKDGKTLVQQRLAYKVKFGAFGAILNSLVMKSKMDAAIQDAFEGLKQYAETN